MVVKVQLLLLDSGKSARFFTPVVKVTLNFLLPARSLDGSLGYGSNVTVLFSTLTCAGTGCHFFFLAFHWYSLAEVESESSFISSENVAEGLVSRLTPVCLLFGVMPSLPSVLSVSSVGALSSSLIVKVCSASSLPALSVAW